MRNVKVETVKAITDIVGSNNTVDLKSILLLVDKGFNLAYHQGFEHGVSRAIIQLDAHKIIEEILNDE